MEKSAPISVIGTGGTINAATENGLERAATLLEQAGLLGFAREACNLH